MGKTPRAEISGHTILGGSSAQWILRDGVRPVMESFEVTPESAKSLLVMGRAQRPVTLSIHSETRNPLIVKNLYVVSESPANSPFEAKVTLADRRWFWPYAHVKSSYNIRRRVGHRRISNPGVAQIQPIAADLWYAKYSLKNEKTKWEALEVIERVIRAAASKDPLGFSVTFHNPADAANKMPIEDVTFDDTGDAAISRALAYMPELGIYVNKEGNFIVYAKSSGLDKKVVGSAGPEIVNTGHAKVVLNSITRPAGFRVLFSREIEVRHDFIELDSSTTQTIVNSDDRKIDNVLPVPDFSLVISGKTVSQGTWVTFDSYLNSIPNPPGLGGARIDHDFLQRAAVPYVDLWGALALIGVRDPDADWVARISTMQQHWRKTFRLRRGWRERMISFKAVRVSTVDPESGTRGIAPVYADHCLVASRRGHWKDRIGNVDLSYASNIKAYPRTSNGNTVNQDGTPPDIVSGALPAPALINILDEDMGIITLDYRIDPFKIVDMVIPSKMEGDSLPKGDPRDRKVPIAFNSIIDNNKPVRMEKEHKAAIIITMVPGSPNDINQLHPITIDKEDVADMVPGGIPGSAFGPIMDIRIRPGKESARIAWVDANKSITEAAFGIPRGAQAVAFPDTMVMNADASGAGGASLNEIAKAAAAAAYAAFADRVQGQSTVGLEPRIEPSGFINEVTHKIESNTGVLTTQIKSQSQPPKVSLFAILGESERNLMLRLPQR